MINWVMKKYGNTKPVVIDGYLFVTIAMAASMEAILTSKEVYDYMWPWIVFYLKMILAMYIAGAMALKTFRDKAYSQHRESEDAKASLALPDSKQTITEQKTTIVETKPTNETTPKVINPAV